MPKKLTDFIKHMHRGPYSKFSKKTQEKIRITFITLATTGLIALIIMALFF